MGVALRSHTCHCGSRITEEVELQCAPQEVSPDGMTCQTCPIFGQNDQAFLPCLNQSGIGCECPRKGWPSRDSPLCSRGHTRLSCKLSLVCTPSSFGSKSLLRGIQETPVHVHHTEKCRHVRGEQRRYREQVEK